MPVAQRIKLRPPSVAVSSGGIYKGDRRTGRIVSVAVAAKPKTAGFDSIVSTKDHIGDPFGSYYGVNEISGAKQILQPTYDLYRLAEALTISNILRQCIESYVVNIDMYGGTLEYIGPEGKMDSGPSQAEKAELNGFINTVSAEFSLVETRCRHRWDKETVGFGTFEVARDMAGRIVLFDHVPSVTMRMCGRDNDPVVVEQLVQDFAKGIGKYTTKTVKRYFRRFVQVAADGRKVYFKEFGDPRTINPKTGAVDDTLSIEDEATEILYLGHYSPASVYGLPRWIGQVPSILGSRESELVNLNFFRENAIPAMAVLVSGGALTEESFQTITNYLGALRGQKSMHRMIVLEATADDTVGSTDHAQSAPKIDMKPMISERQQDGLFQDYDQKSQQKVRSSFRLPPIYAGRAEDYTRASAQASMQTAENQIFGPERLSFDDMFNSKVLISYHPRYWRYKSYGPPLNEPETLSRMLMAFETTGALTPNVAIKIANRMLDVYIEPINEDWGDMPFALTMEALQTGAKIPSLEQFIEQIEEPPPVPPGGIPGQKPPANSNTKPKPAAKDNSLKQTLRRELRIMADDLKQAIEDGRDAST